MDYLDEIGREKIAQHDQELGAYAYRKLSQIQDWHSPVRSAHRPRRVW